MFSQNVQSPQDIIYWYEEVGKRISPFCRSFGSWFDCFLSESSQAKRKYHREDSRECSHFLPRQSTEIQSLLLKGFGSCSHCWLREMQNLEGNRSRIKWYFSSYQVSQRMYLIKMGLKQQRYKLEQYFITFRYYWGLFEFDCWSHFLAKTNAKWEEEDKNMLLFYQVNKQNYSRRNIS